MTATYKDHPLAAIFPLMESDELKELGEDIRQNTQRAPITLYENKILDGRNRYRACLSVNVEPKTRQYAGSDPLGFVISANLKRKHYNESQRGMIAAKLASGNGASPPASTTSKSDSANLRSVTVASAAEKLNVGTRTVETAKQVLKEAPKKEIKAIESGKKTVAAVAKEIKESKTKTDSLLDRFGRIVPDEVAEDWKRAERVGKKLVSLAREIKSVVSQGFAGAKQDRVKDAIYAEISNSSISEAESLAWSLSSIIPYAVCPSCAGHNRKTCALCKKRGWISKFLWNSPAVSDDTKKLISGK